MKNCHFHSIKIIEQFLPVSFTVIFLFFTVITAGCATTNVFSDTKYKKLSVSFVNESKSGLGSNTNNQNLLGMNNLYWIDDDKAWGQKNLGATLSQANVTALRYPGGEVADNYNWETNSLENPNEFPKEAPNASLKAQRLDYLEFLGHAAKMGVTNIFFVVNVEGAFLAPGNTDNNILLYAQKAARWVADVKRHGYHVSYWEIGNEPYLSSTTYSLTPLEYAKALKIYYREMKRADPSIQIGVTGPEGLQGKGFAGLLTEEQLAHVRKDKDFCKNERANDCAESVKKLIPGENRGMPWWNTIVDNAKDSFDFVAIHDYSIVEKQLAHTNQIQKLSSYLQQSTGKKVDIAVTEWNVPNRKKGFTNTADIALDNAVKLGNYLVGQVNYAIFWPIRSEENSYRALLTFDSAEPTILYKTFKLITPVLAGRPVNQLSLDKDVYFLQTQTKQETTAMLVNRGEEGKLVKADLNSVINSNVEIEQLDVVTEKVTVTNGKAKLSNSIEFTLPPKSVTVVKYK
ncbi:MAG: hypothetical protein EPN17_14520 [Methylobacter sp.]|nr:MAG: hypothetical protein EPN17_14520 [Methylobacter sp.]